MKELNYLKKIMTDTEIGSAIGVGSTTVYRWRIGHNKPQKVFEKKIKEVYERIKKEEVK